MLVIHNMKRLLLLAVMLGMMAAPSQAADWRLTAARKTPFGSSLAFIDLQSIRGGNGRVQFSTLTFFSRQTLGMNRVAALVTADCRTLSYRFDQLTLLRNQQPLSSWHSAANAVAMPKSNVYDSISAACGIAVAGTHVEAVEAFAQAHFRMRARRMFR